MLHANSPDDQVKQIAREVGNPKYGDLNIFTKIMLLENPTSLNIPGGLSSDTMIKRKVLEGLKRNAADGTIKNEVIRESLNFTESYQHSFVGWLFNIRPIFPRFLSEFYSSTYFRIAEGVVSVFQNSRSIRKYFSKDFTSEVNQVILKGEKTSITSLLRGNTGQRTENIWNCSATKADEMRRLSWGKDLVGLTVPHPAEFLEERGCTGGCGGSHVVSKKVPIHQRAKWTRGPMMPYLGSKTKESTSIVQPWEKNIEVPLLRRANNLRKVLNWFVDSKSNLGESIYGNLSSLMGVDMSEELEHFRRTGSSQHRLRCSRVSNEGNPAISFNNLTYVTVTTDAMGEINEINHDFMYQTLLCWAGILSILPGNQFERLDTTHYHITDQECLRPIEEHTLEAPTVFTFPDKSKSIKKMVTTDLKMNYLPRITAPRVCTWENLSGDWMSWHLGRAQGLMWSLAVLNKEEKEIGADLFPTTITRKVYPLSYMEGLHRGFCLGAVFPTLYARYCSLSEKARLKFEGSYWIIVSKAVNNSNLADMVSHSNFTRFLTRTGGDLIKSYPTQKHEVTAVIHRWFTRRLIQDRQNKTKWKTMKVLGFADMNTDYIMGMFRLSERLLPIFQYDRLSASNLRALNQAKVIIRLLTDCNHNSISLEDRTTLEGFLQGRYLPIGNVVNAQARHAVSSIVSAPTILEDVGKSVDYKEDSGLGCTKVLGDFIPHNSQRDFSDVVKEIEVEQIRCTLFSSVRVVQLATGAHYKYKDLSRDFKLKGDGIFCGDGSGGIGANHLRKNKGARVIFNSKLDLTGDALKGLAPGGPGAYLATEDYIVDRCVNHSSCWEDPSDLSLPETWENFIKLRDQHRMSIQVIFCDAEIQDDITTDKVENNILHYMERIYPYREGTLVYKTYGKRVFQRDSLIHRIGLYFSSVTFAMPETQGSFTSEIYVVAQGRTIPEVPTPTELTPACMVDLLYNLKVKRTAYQEFQRALNFRYNISTVGLREKIPFLHLHEVSGLLISVGLDSGMALYISEKIMDYSEKRFHPFGAILILGYLSSRHMIPITSWTGEVLKIPSAYKIQRLSGVLFGLWFGLCLVTDDPLAFNAINKLYQGELSFAFGRAKQ